MNLDDVDIFQSGGLVESINKLQEGGEVSPDALDRLVTGYEENVPLIAQIGAGFTPPGMALDVAAAGKYGRDAFRDFSAGNLGQGAVNLGIAGLSGLAAIPLVGELANLGKIGLKRAVKTKSGTEVTNPTLKRAIKVEEADTVVDVNKIDVKQPSGKTKKQKQQRIELAEDIIKNLDDGFTYKGVSRKKRQPIEVLQMPGGRFKQLGGGSTIQALQNLGVTDIPVRVFPSEGLFKQYNTARKIGKTQELINDATKLQPQAGNLTSEALVRKFGSKPLAYTKSIFNKHQADLNSIDEMFVRSVKLNKGFQDEISDIAESLGTRTARKLDDIDEVTGSPVGEVKGIDRITEKSFEKYQGDFLNVTDPMRTRILVRSADEEDALVNLISKRYPTLDSQRQINQTGYMDRKLNIQYTAPSGEKIVAEIALVHPKMLVAGDKMHPVYKQYRAIQKKIETGELKGPPLRSAKILAKKLKKEMIAEFGDVLREIPEEIKNTAVRLARGGQVTSLGRSGRFDPNIFTNSDWDSSEPLMTKSKTCEGVAGIQFSPVGGIKKAASSSPRGSMTAGPNSQEKYSVPSLYFIKPIIQNFTKSNNV
jgi:hypothetical protein